MDAGSHLASITRILEKDFPLVAGVNPHSTSTTQPEEAPSIGGDANSGDEASDGNERSESLEVTVTALKTGPFAGLEFPHASARANAAHVVREHVATYLITHPHLDHLSGFASTYHRRVIPPFSENEELVVVMTQKLRAQDRFSSDFRRL